MMANAIEARMEGVWKLKKYSRRFLDTGEVRSDMLPQAYILYTPGGFMMSITVEENRQPPAGEVYHAIESPKGELGFFIVSDGKSMSPYRFRVRPPSFCNLQALPRLVKGHLIADVVALIGSLDVVLGEVDR